MKLRPGAPRWPVLACCLLGCAQAGASGHFDVDDAGTLDAGHCQLEAWAGRVRQAAQMRFQHIGGACAVGPVELGLNADRASVSGRQAAFYLGPQIKWTFWGREADAAWSAAAAVAATFDARHGGRPGAQFVLPWHWRVDDRLNLLVNAGADWASGGAAASVRKGAAVEWAGSEHLTLIAERHRAFASWTSRIGARLTIAPLTTLELSVARTEATGDRRPRSIVVGLNREFGPR